MEGYPYGLLTMIVSLEEEDQQNRELLDLANQILALTKELHAAQHNGRPVQASKTTT